MAQNRTFLFKGNAYGNTPVNLTVNIGGIQVFSGAVTTVDQEPGPYNPATQVVLFSIDNSSDLNTDFAGAIPTTITVTGGNSVTFGEIIANYHLGNTVTDPTAGTVDHFLTAYNGFPTNSDNSDDTRSSVVINGEPQVQVRPPNGDWNYDVFTDSTMTYNFNLCTGQVGNVLGNVANYTGAYSSYAKWG